MSVRSLAKEEVVAVRTWILLVLLVTLSACAQPQHIKTVSHYKTDFASRLDINVSYEQVDNKSFASVFMGNPKKTDVLLWMVLKRTVPGELVLRETLVYEGNDKSLHKIYRLPMGETGTTGTLYIKVLNSDNRELLRSPVVDISSIGETK